jgi:hypothetical protein
MIKLKKAKAIEKTYKIIILKSGGS